jgi:hypothetical protein
LVSSLQYTPFTNVARITNTSQPSLRLNEYTVFDLVRKIQIATPPNGQQVVRIERLYLDVKHSQLSYPLSPYIHVSNGNGLFFFFT